MARKLEQVIQSLEPGYKGSRQTIKAQQEALPGQTQSQLAGLQAQAGEANEDILDSARRRGLGFGGIPIAEQAEFQATQFMPAVANLKQSQNQRSMSLDEALNALYRDQRSAAMGIRQEELGRDQQREQYQKQLAWEREKLDRQEEMAREARAAQQAAAAASSGPGIASYFDGGSSGGGGGKSSGGTSKMFKKSNGQGFGFTNSGGKAISAATYAKSKGVAFRSLLQQMASNGDSGAAAILPYVGNDFGVNRPKLNRIGMSDPLAHKRISNTLRAIMW